METTDECFEKAVDSVLAGRSVRESAKTNGVPLTKLWKYVHEHFPQKIMPARGRILYDDEEKQLKRHILESAERGFPYTLDAVREAMHRIIVAIPRPIKGNSFPSRHAVANFINRHPELTLRTPSNISASSANITQNSMFNWFAWFIDLLDRKKLREFFDNHPQNKLNIDESNLPADVKPKKGVTAKGMGRLHKITHPNSKLTFTLTVAGDASGYVYKPFILLKGERITEQLKTNMPETVDYALSEEGYQTQDTFVGKRFIYLSSSSLC